MTVRFSHPADFEPAELVLWTHMGWAESLPFLHRSLLNPRLVLAISTEDEPVSSQP